MVKRRRDQESPWRSPARRVIAELIWRQGRLAVSELRSSDPRFMRRSEIPYPFYNIVKESRLIVREKRGIYRLRVPRKCLMDKCPVHSRVGEIRGIGYHNAIILGCLRAKPELTLAAFGDKVAEGTNLERYEARIPVCDDIGFTVSVFPRGSLRILAWDRRSDQAICCLLELYKLLKKHVIEKLRLIDLVVLRAVEQTVILPAEGNLPSGWVFSVRRIDDGVWEMRINTNTIYVDKKLWDKQELVMIKAYTEKRVMRVEAKFGDLFVILPIDVAEFELDATSMFYNALLPTLAELRRTSREASLKPINACAVRTCLIPSLRRALERLGLALSQAAQISSKRRERRRRHKPELGS